MSPKAVSPALFFYQPRMGMIFVVSEFRLRGRASGKMSFSDARNNKIPVGELISVETFANHRFLRRRRCIILSV